MTWLFMVPKNKNLLKSIVLTGGTFNSVHPGYKYLLKKAKALGDYLVVVIAHDKHNKKPNAVPVKVRKKNIERLRIADKVVIGSPKSFVGVVYKFKPKIIVLGYDQELPDEETKQAVKNMKISIVRCKKYRNYSASRLSHKRIKKASAR